MRVLVTGGAGFVGVNLTRRLLRDGVDVVILDDLSSGLASNIEDSSAEFVPGSLARADDVLEAAEGCTHVVHLGARGSVPRSLRNPQATHEVNATGTLNVLEACRRTGAHLVFSSSSSVFGASPVVPKREDVLTAPLTPYAASKLAAEAYIQAYQNSFGVSALTLRFFNVYGPWQRPDHDYAAVVPKWIWKAMRGDEIVINGDGSITRDFTHVDDVVEVIVRSLKERIEHPSPVNLAFGRPISLLEVVDELRDHFQDITTVFDSPRAGDIQHSENDPALLNGLFPGIEPQPFREGFASTVSWLREHGDAVAGGPPVQD